MILSKSFIKSLLFGKSLTYSGQRNKPKQCKKYFRVDHVMFDLDGAILDNLESVDNAYRAVFEKHCLCYTQEWRFKMMGMTGKTMWRKVIEELKVKTEWQQMYEYYKEVVQGSLEEAPLRPGVERLLNHLEQHKVPMALVTSSTRATMEIKTKHIEDIMSKFVHVVAAGDDQSITKSKPNGQIFGIAAQRFLGKPEPETCLVFEATPNGVMAASCACMQVIGIPCPPITDIGCVAFANEVMHTMNGFWPGKYGLPPFPEQVGGSPPPNRY